MKNMNQFYTIMKTKPQQQFIRWLHSLIDIALIAAGVYYLVLLITKTIIA